jgi:tetratricopeptide (TPR) repeat protein
VVNSPDSSLIKKIKMKKLIAVSAACLLIYFGGMAQKINQCDSIARKQAEKEMFEIFKREIEPLNEEGKATPSEDDLKKLDIVMAQYGSTGAEILARTKVIHYLERNNFDEFFPTTEFYIEQFPDGPSAMDLNNWAWHVFEKTSDRKKLQAAIGWVNRSLKKDRQPHTYDTYANLLYRMGNTDEAIRMEEKALELTPDDWQKRLWSGDKNLYLKTIEKMRKGIPTWN